MKADEWQNTNTKVAVLLMLIGVCFGVVLLYKYFVNIGVTPAVEVTDSQRVEIATMIEKFELSWNGLEGYHDPSIQAEVATDPYLKHYGFAYGGKESLTTPEWRVTRSAKVNSIRALEYNPERIKVIASVVFLENVVAPIDRVLRTFNTEFCKVYVFTPVDSVWKVGGLLTLTNPANTNRDWSRAPDWLKQVLGEIRYYDGCD